VVLLLNYEKFEKRAAVLEDGKLVEFYREKKRRQEVIGNIYKGKVLRVMPGLESAFLNIGLEKAAFLSVSDMNFSRADDSPRIEKLLKRKDEILVQVLRDPVRNKGVKLTTSISVANSFMVLYPERARSGVSAKIHPVNERKRLKDILDEITPEGCGLIARTNSAGLAKEALISARDDLMERWRVIQEKSAASGAPKLIYEEEPLIPRLLRDIRQADLEGIITDDEDMRSLLPAGIPPDKLTVYNGTVPLFVRYGVEAEAEKILNRKISLPSGGYIVIDQAEAFTVIDVNTGHFTGSVDLEQTVLKTNSEAAEEIARALRLRNIGGIIIVDFIDMQNSENREKIKERMNTLLSKDRAKACVVDITPLGLMEITRKRTGDNLSAAMYEPCPYCGGKGMIKDSDAVCLDIFNELKREAAAGRGKGITIEASAVITDILNNSGRETLDLIAAEYNIELSITARSSFRKDSYIITRKEA
jgi:ribonuclease G